MAVSLGRRDWEEDPDLRALRQTPALVGGKRIWMTDICVRRRAAQEGKRRQPQTWYTLRQLLETGCYRQSPPAWMPEALVERFQGYVLLPGERALALVARGPREFNAVGWFEEKTIARRARVEARWQEDDDEVLGVDVTGHCLQRFRERAGFAGAKSDALEALADLIERSLALPEWPSWFDDRDYGGQQDPAFILVGDERFLIPLIPSSRPRANLYVALTLLHRRQPPRGR